jgi:hypothetical protein
MATKTKSVSINVPKNAKVVTREQTVEEYKAMLASFRQKEALDRIEKKCDILDKCNSSDDVFNMLSQEINTLEQDGNSNDFSVGDTYNFGTEYEIELLLELTSDLRWYTRYSNDDDNKSIDRFNLNYLRKYF